MVTVGVVVTENANVLEMEGCTEPVSGALLSIVGAIVSTTLVRAVEPAALVGTGGCIVAVGIVVTVGAKVLELEGCAECTSGKVLGGDGENIEGGEVAGSISEGAADGTAVEGFEVVASVGVAKGATVLGAAVPGNKGATKGDFVVGFTEAAIVGAAEGVTVLGAVAGNLGPTEGATVMGAEVSCGVGLAVKESVGATNRSTPNLPQLLLELSLVAKRAKPTRLMLSRVGEACGLLTSKTDSGKQDHTGTTW